MHRKLILLVAVCLFATGAWAKDIVIYHTTDMHGHYFSRADKNGAQFGGFARLETLLKNTKEPFLLLDSGDFSSGSHEASVSAGKYSTDLMNMTGYHALTIGNHDSDFGDAGLSKMLADFDGDVLAMNMSNLHIPNKSIKPHVVYNVEGVKVGIIGVAMDGSGMERMKIVNAPTAQEFEAQIQAVKQKGAEVIIILAHDSLLDDESISADKRSNILAPLKEAPSFKDVTLMLGGHAHIQRLVGKLAADDGQGPWALEGGPYMGSVDKTVIHKDDKTGKISVEKPVFIDLNGQEDENIKKYLDKIRDTSLDSTIFAYVPKLITKYPSPEQVDRAPAVARLMADQMYKAIAPEEKIDLAAYSLNSTRSDYKPAQLTGRYFAEMAPYDEHAGTFDITGSHLLRAMQESLGFRDGRCFSVYGYSKNVHLQIMCKGEKPLLVRATVNGKEINPRKTYRMAMLTHLPRGFYEGKPFQVLASDAVDDGSVIKHYRDVKSASMLFGIIEQFKQEQGQDIPAFIAPADVQIEEVNSLKTPLSDSESVKAGKRVTKLLQKALNAK
jgi:2',3'-cyclic-nucleotide 2'-phosphodiesterase (5'-nucleotidase family)